MKRMHIHVTVDSIDQSVQFYNILFGSEPTKIRSDYAKWMLDDPRVNFAISTHGEKAGVDHLGIQVEQEAELAEMRGRFNAANLDTFDDGEVDCCYAHGDKAWLTDPAGVAWENYQTMHDVQHYGSGVVEKNEACCTPETKGEPGCCEPPDATAGCCA